MPAGDQFFLLGIDGGCWEIIEPLIAQGKLPNLARMMREGAYGDLLAENPFSPPSWATIATGLSAKEHGFSHFTRHLPGKLERVFLNYSMVDAPCIWEIVESEGKRAGVLKWQSLPQYPRNLVTQSEKNLILSGMGFSFILKALRIKLARYFRLPYIRYRFIRENIATDWQMRVTEYVLKRKSPHFMAYRIFSTDEFQHCFWKYHFSSRYKVDPADLKKYGTAISDLYQKVDKFIGKLIKGNIENILIVSDHGFKGFSREPEQTLAALYNVNYEKILNKLGLLQYRENKGSIDWKRTKAYWCGDPRFFHEFAINLKEREPDGSVSREDYERVREELKGAFESVRFQDTGERLFTKITLHDGTPYYKHIDFNFLGEEVRLWNNDAFDLIIEDGYKCRFQDDSIMKKRVIIGSNAYEMREFLTPSIWSAGHSLRGIFMARGKDIKAGRINALSTLDIAPSLLFWMKLPIPSSMEGKIQTGIFKDEFIRQNPAKITATKAQPRSAGAKLSKGEEERIKEDLRGLGYL